VHQPLIQPKRLPPNGTIGVVAPAGKVDQGDLHRGVIYMEKMGYRVILGRHVEKMHRYFAGEDRDRANDFVEMMQNKEVDAVICARGGSGSARIIPYIPPTAISPKIFVGCSDITTLLLYLSLKYGFVTFHGPMVAPQIGDCCANPVGVEAADYLFQVLSGETIKMSSSGMTTLKSGVADGILTGGCLSLICTTIGTPYEIDTHDRIVFIEDIAEAPYRIDRMLYFLKTLNKFDNIRGLIFGQMPKCQMEQLPEIILDIFSEFDFPILFGFPAGHGDSLFTLPIGTPVRIDTDTMALIMLSPAVL